MSRIAKIPDEDSYRLTLAEMFGWIQDNHGTRFGTRAIRDVLLGGKADLPFSVKAIEGRPLITQIHDEEIAKSGTVEIGDEIIAVDGKNALDIFNDWGKYISTSRKEMSDDILSAFLLLGPEGSQADLLIEGKNGRKKHVKFIRRTISSWPPLRSGPILKKLSEDLGYIDFDRLLENQLPDADTLIANSKGLIFDMRGYPTSAAPYQIIDKHIHQNLDNPKLQKKSEYIGKIPMTIHIGGSNFGETFDEYGGLSRFELDLPNPVLLSNKKIVLLTNLEAQSAAENVVLSLDNIKGVTIVGSPTSGAMGRVTAFTVPGGHEAVFTGSNVRYGDGSQIQRLGIAPHIEVRPTIQGIREGRDEVLETAIDHLNGIINKKVKQ